LLALMPAGAVAQTTERPFANVERTYGDVVAWDRKLIEQEAVPLDGAQPSGTLCLIAAVSLSRDAAREPPRRDRTRPLYAQFGGDWKPTPMAATGPRGKDILAICEAFLRADRFDQTLLNALETPGSFYLRDFTGSLLQVYAPDRRIAVSIRLAQRRAGQ
jgi:hypothetical protein